MIHRFSITDRRDLADLPWFQDSGFQPEDVLVSHTMTPKVYGVNLGVCTDCGTVLLRSFAAKHRCGESVTGEQAQP